MSFFEELTKKATGLATGILGDIKGTNDDGTSSANLQNMFQNADNTRFNTNLNTAGGLNIGSARGAGNYPQNPNLVSSDILKRITLPDGTVAPVKTISRNVKVNDSQKKAAMTEPGKTTALFNDTKKTPKLEDTKNALGITNEQSKQFFGMDLNQIKQSWKDKGGFEGLMANPGFTLGLAIMSSSAQGRPISESLLNNVLASGEISSAYADRIKARSKVLAPITQAQRDEVESVFAEDNYFGPDLIDKAKKGNQSAKFREATDMVYDRANKLAQKDAQGGKEVRLDRSYFRKALDELISEGKIDKRKPSFFGLRAGTVEATGGIDGARAEGGPVEANKNYLVGEKGPEVFVPQVDGNIINNDDAKVVNMLLEHNPQLKNISRARAVKILKNRFPDYF
jgi:hypothetical protein